jgi:RNA polymerase sigma-70 factor (ECF subfamily)
MKADPQHDASFQKTQWSVVAMVRQSPDSPLARQALAKLCGIYWFPLYAFARRSGYGVEDAQDVTQGFFATVVRDNLFAVALPEKGILRTFLLASFRNHMANERTREQAAKRGGKVEIVPLDFGEGERRYLREPTDPMTPETHFDRNWALAAMRAARQSLASQEERAGRGAQFKSLAGFLGTRNDADADYAAVAAGLGMTAEAARKAASRLREKLRKCVLQQIANTMDSPDSRRVEEELATLIAALAGR